VEEISSILDTVSASIIKDWCDRCKAVQCIYTLIINTAWSFCSGRNGTAVGGITKSLILYMPHPVLFSPEKSRMLLMLKSQGCSQFSMASSLGNPFTLSPVLCYPWSLNSVLIWCRVQLPLPWPAELDAWSLYLVLMVQFNHPTFTLQHTQGMEDMLWSWCLGHLLLAIHIS
jgi:hypothetical protein